MYYLIIRDVGNNVAVVEHTDTLPEGVKFTLIRSSPMKMSSSYIKSIYNALHGVGFAVTIHNHHRI